MRISGGRVMHGGRGSPAADSDCRSGSRAGPGARGMAGRHTRPRRGRDFSYSSQSGRHALPSESARCGRPDWTCRLVGSARGKQRVKSALALSRPGNRHGTDGEFRPESASRCTRCQRGRHEAGSGRVVSPTLQAGPDGTCRFGPGWAVLAGPKGFARRSDRKPAAAASRNDENTAEPGSRIAAPR